GRRRPSTPSFTKQSGSQATWPSRVLLAIKLVLTRKRTRPQRNSVTPTRKASRRSLATIERSRSISLRPDVGVSRFGGRRSSTDHSVRPLWFEPACRAVVERQAAQGEVVTDGRPGGSIRNAPGSRAQSALSPRA